MSAVDSIVMKFFAKLMANVSVEDCEKYIINNISMFNTTKESDWNNYKRIVSLIPGAKKIKLDYNTVVDALGKTRPDVLATICCTNGGPQWLNDQIKFCRVKIGIDPPRFSRL